MRSSLIIEKNKFWFKLKLALSIISIWWLVSFVNLYFGISLSNFSIHPHSTNYLLGIFTYPFIHGDIEHLINNSLSGFIIFSTLFIVYEQKSIQTLLLVYIFSGTVLWFIGAEGSRHVGASSIIYGLAFYMFLSGLIIRNNSNLSLSLFMVAWYGSMVWGITPYTVEDGISWEGHLSGAIVGSILAVWHYKDEMFKQKKYAEDEDDLHFFERYPYEDEEDTYFLLSDHYTLKEDID